MNTLQHVGESLIPAIAYGDAAGLPVETMDADTIRRKYGRIGYLLAANHNPFFVGEHPPGMWSDDTELSIAVSQSLIAAEGFTIESQAESIILAYEKAYKIQHRDRVVPRGWGGSTTNSVKRLMQGMYPSVSGERDGAGNGVLMKMAPLVYWQTARGTTQEQRHAEYDGLTKMTHGSEIAAICSRTHGEVLGWLLDTTNPDASDLVERMQESASSHSLVTNQALTDALRYLDGTAVTPETIISETDGKGFFAPQTLAIAYGAYFAGSTYAERVYTAVNLGGDTDSIASIVGTMSLYADKVAVLPEDAKLLQRRELLQRTSHRLAEAACRTL